MALFGRKKPVPEPVTEPVAEEPLPQRTVEEHRAVVLDGARPLPPFGMQVNDAAGLELCEDIAADLDLPMVTTARVAGYGIRAANIVGAGPQHPIDLRLMGAVERPDELPTLAVAPGGCVLLAAGAPVPKGVDAVVPLEEATRAGRAVTFVAEAQLNQHLSLRGSALPDGTRLLAAGDVLDARAVALLCEVGLDKVLVRPRPRLVVFAVGPDLLPPGAPVTAVNQRYSAGTALVAAAARASGATVYQLDALKRDPAAIRTALVDQAIRADAMVVLAQDEADAHLLAEVLKAQGEADLAHVTFAHGHALPVGRLGDERLPVVVLPATPLAACAGFHLFVAPLLERLGAREAASPARVEARLATGLAASVNTRYLPGRLDGDRVEVRASEFELAYDLVRADVLVEVPAGEPLDAGATVSCLPLRGPAPTPR